MLMAAASPDDIPAINVRVAIPAGSVLTENLAGYRPLIGPRRVEIRQRLISYGITPDAFPEFVTGTRFDLKYMLSVSDRIGQYETFRNEKVYFSRQTASGGESQIIVTRPLEDEGLELTWNKTIVQATSAAK
jgi:hypothetical protein